MSEDPALGQIVLYASERNDGVVSPAIVLRTRADTVREVIEKWPSQKVIEARESAIADYLDGTRTDFTYDQNLQLQYDRVWNMLQRGEDVRAMTLSGKGRPDDLVIDLQPGQVDLLVHGLGGDYRRYGVKLHSASCGVWPCGGFYEYLLPEEAQ